MRKYEWILMYDRCEIYLWRMEAWILTFQLDYTDNLTIKDFITEQVT